MAAPNPISYIAIKQFEDIYLELYESKQKLQNTSLERHGIVGDSYQWSSHGNVDMHDRGPFGSVIPVTELAHDKLPMTFKDYALKLALDKGEQTLIQIDERQMHAQRHAAATGRRLDQWKIDALDASTGYLVVDDTKNLTVAKLIAARMKLLDNNAPEDGLMMLITPSQLKGLLSEDQVTSADYNTIRTLVNGEVDSFMGFRFIVLGSTTLTGLPKTGDIRTCFAWHKSAIGLGMKMAPNIDVEYSGERRSHISTSSMIGNAIALENKGIVKIDCDETK